MDYLFEDIDTTDIEIADLSMLLHNISNLFDEDMNLNNEVEISALTQFIYMNPDIFEVTKFEIKKSFNQHKFLP